METSQVTFGVGWSCSATVDSSQHALTGTFSTLVSPTLSNSHLPTSIHVTSESAPDAFSAADYRSAYGWNAHSIVNKLKHFHSYVASSSLHIFGNTETWCTSGIYSNEIG